METREATREGYQEALKDIIGYRKSGLQRSFFSRRLERYVEGKVDVSRRIFTVLDTPFKEFTPMCERLYREKIESNYMLPMFSDMLVEIYRKLDADKYGWEAAANFLDETPMKRCALDAMHKAERLKKRAGDGFAYMVRENGSLSMING
ncbi:MAG: hypothetical protein SWK76_09290 [Actinomycetota bacterium]|nr:hypothetical protein [Actinomycetota bacterium]